MAKIDKKIIYNYSPETGEFLYESEARESPREPGVYLIPAFATEIEPPKLKKPNTVAIFNEETGRWNTKEDYRNTSIYSKETGEIVCVTEIGPLPKNLTTIKKPGPQYIWSEKENNWIEDNDILIAQQLEANIHNYRNKSNAPIKFNNALFSVDLIPEIALALSLSEFPKTFTLLDNDFEIHEFNREQLEELAKGFQDRKQKLNKNFIAKKRKTMVA
jgi:hypothetical protein